MPPSGDFLYLFGNIKPSKALEVRQEEGPFPQPLPLNAFAEEDQDVG